jgi:hypothetical protein
MTSAYAMCSDITSRLVIDEDLAALSARVGNAEPGDHLEIDYLINEALGLPKTTSLMTSLDATLSVLRERFPPPEWRYGFQDGGYRGYTGPTAWLNNGRPQKTGFENRIDHSYRYHERCARTIEAAFASLLLHALSYREA